MGRKPHPFALSGKGKSVALTLSPVVDILAAPDLHAALLKALERGRTIAIDAAPVERISTPAIQVLLAAAKAAEAAKLKFRVTNPSPALVSAFADLGLKPTLDQWSATA
jgi:anti-anti-sigma regulatory factor